MNALVAPQRCPWSLSSDALVQYHDTEWGVPLHEDRKLFEFMVLDAFQAGLTWSTILNRRQNFLQAFDNFDPAKIAVYDEEKVSMLLLDSGIIRNRLKIRAAITNAKAFLNVQKEFGAFDQYIWQFTDYKVKKNTWKQQNEIPARTEESDAMSKDLKKWGFTFVGSTICYAFMQAAGMVNDHVMQCFRYREV